jgi:2-keto-4-pentenoate hydratase/2-oxohepta-3-ene-1,7-dioic acid hydratase in catechol pathway
MLDDDNVLRDLSGHLPDIDARVLSPGVLSELAGLDAGALPKVDAGVRFGVPIAGISKCIGIGLNYSDHAAEVGKPAPDEPIIFMKSVSSLCGANDPILVPPDSGKTDWEVELAIVIGTRASRVPLDRARSFVAGYTICNDVSERDYQLERGGTWDKGKGCDSFGPLGPMLVTADEVADPQNLDMWLDVNGERMQTGSTRTMIFGVDELVSYVSHFITLYPGDVIVTGTPPGVGMGKKPPRFLKAGDVVTLGVEGLGTQRQECVDWEDRVAATEGRGAA